MDEALITALDGMPVGEVFPGWDSFRAFMVAKRPIRIAGVRRTPMQNRPLFEREGAKRLIESGLALNLGRLKALELGEPVLFEPKPGLVGSATYLHGKFGVSADLVSLAERICGEGQWRKGALSTFEGILFIALYCRAEAELLAMVAPVTLAGLKRVA